MTKYHLVGMFSCSFMITCFYCLALREIISEQEFDQVLQQEQKMVVDFYASWSWPCQYMMILLVDLEKELSSPLFVKVNTDLLRHIATTYDVRSLPTVILFCEGQEIDRIQELLPRNEMEQRIRNAYR